MADSTYLLHNISGKLCILFLRSTIRWVQIAQIKRYQDSKVERAENIARNWKVMNPGWICNVCFGTAHLNLAEDFEVMSIQPLIIDRRFYIAPRDVNALLFSNFSIVKKNNKDSACHLVCHYPLRSPGLPEADENTLQAALTSWQQGAYHSTQWQLHRRAESGIQHGLRPRD